MNWTIKSKSTQVSAEFQNDIVRIDVSYNIDATSGKMQSMNGSVYCVETSRYIGNFSNNNGSYSFNGVKLDDMDDVVSAIKEIEKKIEE